MASSSKPISITALENLSGRLISSIVLTPESEGYQEALQRWSDTAVKQAGVVVLPLDPVDIRTALLWAQEHLVDLAVKGGAHTVTGTSSSDGGLVIDLSRMNKVIIDPVKKTAIVQGGALWRDVNKAAEEYTLATVGGMVDHTGVGGLTLGGGLGWLSGQYGLVIDNLLSATVVVADGRILTASATENPDLFWGLRGAGHNFGIVVDFTYQLHEQKNPVLAGLLSFAPEKLEPVIEALNGLLSLPDPKSGAVLLFSHPPYATAPGVDVVCFYNGSYDEGMNRFSALKAIGPLHGSLEMIPYSKLNTLQNPGTTSGDRKTLKGIFSKGPLDPKFARFILTEFTNKLYEDPDLRQSSVVLEFWDLRKILEVPQTATSFAGRNRAQKGTISMRWTDSSKDGQNIKWSKVIQAKWKSELDSKAAADEFQRDTPQYINYAEPGDSIVPNIYGENLSRLQQVKAKYDPRNIFNKMNPIRPAISAGDGA